MSQGKRRIFVLYTGGTIGMVQSGRGLRPDAALAEKALLPFSDGLSFDWHICAPLIDSSAVTLENWRDWLALLAEKIPQYDGVLVLHGTDTLAYTANLFALALHSLDKPLVLTGSQWPFGAPGSDAPRNLATAAAALRLGLPQCVIAFDGKLFPAVGSSKVSTETADGFANPHFGALAQWSEAEGRISLRDGLRPSEKPSGGLRAERINPAVSVSCHTLIPGGSARHIAAALRQGGADAAILQSYGHGNAPSDEGFIDAVRSFTSRGGLLLNISQVPQGCAAAVYAQGAALRQAGVVGGGKCNLETASVLLTLAAGNGWTADRLRAELAALGLTDA